MRLVLLEDLVRLDLDARLRSELGCGLAGAERVVLGVSAYVESVSPEISRIRVNETYP